MSFSVTIVDAAHRPEVYAEIEYDGELIAEAFAEDGRMKVAFVGVDGRPLWVAEAEDLRDALARAQKALTEAGLFE